jgi:transposase InsO family protein
MAGGAVLFVGAAAAMLVGAVGNDYTDLLKAQGIDISMSRKGNPWDNAACESVMITLKYEEVLRNEYRNLADALASIQEFLEKA